jgi:hypothetical protein
MPEPAPAVRRRRLFHVGGFDPRSPGLTHILYRDESAKQAAALGGSRTVGPAERIGREAVAWEVEDASGCRTRIELLRWDDIVRAHWYDGPLALWRAGLRYYLGVFRRGFVLRMARQAPWCAVTMVLPGATLLALVLAALLAAGAAAGAALLAGMTGWPALGIALFAGAGVVLALRPRLARIPSEWVLRAIMFMREHGLGLAPDVEPRIDAMAARIRAALDEPGVDEVLVVGHSVGAQLAVQALARARALPAASTGGARASLLTLGQVIALTAWWSPRASILADLRALSADPGVDWLDVTAPPDGACMALVDPVAACGLPATGRPRRIPARFHRQFPPERYRRIRRDKFRLHFQYLMAAEQTGGFDWFAVSAGPRPLSAWIADEDGRDGRHP